VVHPTTKEIAQASGVSEPTLYKYFGDKERLPGMSRVTVRPGEGDLEGNLAELAHAALDFCKRAIPMPGADPAASAGLLVGACFQEAFLRHHAHGVDAPAAPREGAQVSPGRSCGHCCDGRRRLPWVRNPTHRVTTGLHSPDGDHGGDGDG
jgi:hypothetical protein